MKWLLLAVLFAGSLAHASDLDVDVSGPDNKGVYQVQGYFEANVSTTIAWQVLTDYNHMSEFLPAITSSTILSSNDGLLMVRQTFLANFLFFHHSADALFQIKLLPSFSVIIFSDTLHQDFVYCSGIWSVANLNGRSGIAYSVRTIPSDSAPHWIIRSVSRKMAVTLLRQLRTEMEKRDTSAL